MWSKCVATDFIIVFGPVWTYWNSTQGSEHYILSENSNHTSSTNVISFIIFTYLLALTARTVNILDYIRARIYRPSFHENKPKTLVFSHTKRAFWACFRENWIYNFGRTNVFSIRNWIKPGSTCCMISAEAELMNVQFSWGFWEFSDLRFPYTMFTLQTSFNYFCSRGGG
jgi:hypothetical protein